MSDIEEQAKARVAKAAWMNEEVNARLHQNDVQAGITIKQEEKPKPKSSGKVADKP